MLFIKEMNELERAIAAIENLADDGNIIISDGRLLRLFRSRMGTSAKRIASIVYLADSGEV